MRVTRQLQWATPAAPSLPVPVPVTDPEIPDASARRGIGEDSPDPRAGQIGISSLGIISRLSRPNRDHSPISSSRNPGRIGIGAKSQFFSRHRSRPNRLFSSSRPNDSDGPGAPGLGDTGGLGFGGLPLAAPIDSPQASQRAAFATTVTTVSCSIAAHCRIQAAC
jgi:hypothetical protein